jgi:hypothetical protein
MPCQDSDLDAGQPYGLFSAGFGAFYAPGPITSRDPGFHYDAVELCFIRMGLRRNYHIAKTSAAAFLFFHQVA